MIVYDACHRGHLLLEILIAPASAVTAQQSYPDTHLVQEYAGAGDPHPPDRPDDSWPETWESVPARCPICDAFTVADHYLNSRAGPGWRCSLTGCEHFWQVRTNALRRCRTAHPPRGGYPWYDTTAKERSAWLEAHAHPPRVVPSSESLPLA